MASRQEKDRDLRSYPKSDLESPFLEVELFVGESKAEWETSLAALETKSPFQRAFELEQEEIVKPKEHEELEWVEAEDQDEEAATDLEESIEELYDEEEAPYAEEEVWTRLEQEEDTYPQEEATYIEEEALDEAEDQDEEAATDLEEGIEELYDEEEALYAEEEVWTELEQEEDTYPQEETTYIEKEALGEAEDHDEEAFIAPEELWRLLSPGVIVQRVRQLLGEGVFSLSLLGRFTSGQIWNEDHLALEILFHRQPRLRPAKLDTVSCSKRLRLLRSLAVKHKRELMPVREGIVRPIFGNPANFQVGFAGECQIRDLREEVWKLGPLPGGKNKRGKIWYKRDAPRSPRKQAAIDSIVLHHMAYNIGNDENLYKKVGAHYIVTANGKIAQLYDDLDYLNTSNRFNKCSIGIEFAGNFPDHRYHWWKSRMRPNPDRCYLTPIQIRVGRCLLAMLKHRFPSIKYIYAHRQSSKTKANDPGPDVWFNIGEWALSNLNLTDLKPRPYVGTGQPIPEIWRMSRSAIPLMTVTPTPTPTKGAAELPAELVRFAQRVLNATESERLAVDGDLGSLTLGALERFRRKYDLGVGDVLDDKTQLALTQRALEEIRRKSMFGQLGVLDTTTREALVIFRSERRLGTDATLDAVTRTALTDALAQRAASVSTSPAEGAVQIGGAPSSVPDKIPSRLGTLVFRRDGQTVFSYEFKPKDLEWTARLISGEAGARDDLENRAVIAAMLNRFALFTHSKYNTFSRFLRAYSTPLQPFLRNKKVARHYMNDPRFVWLDGTLPGTNIPRGQLKRHLELQKTPWEDLLPLARKIALEALTGQMPDTGIGISSEFASTWMLYGRKVGKKKRTETGWLDYTEKFKRNKGWRWIGHKPNLNQKRNAFFIDPRVANLPQDSVQVVQSA